MQKFRVELPGIASVLITPIAIFLPFPLNIPPQDWPKPFQTRAIWDTGATKTVITKNVIDNLNLKASGKIRAHGVHGSKIVDTFLVHIGLPNQFLVTSMRVMEGGLDGTNADVLVGMDIISKGDFIVSNANGKTSFEFGMPAIGISLSDQYSNQFGKGVKIPRNLRVKIKHFRNGQTKEGKYKDLQKNLTSDDWCISEILG